MLSIITGDSIISLRIVDWFVTNFAKKYYTVYPLADMKRFKVYVDYKLKLKAYSKKRFDPFCRWDRISIPYKDGTFIETTIGQLNFFKWTLENDVIDYIEANYDMIEKDMNARNSTSKRNDEKLTTIGTNGTNGTIGTIGTNTIIGTNTNGTNGTNGTNTTKMTKTKIAKLPETNKTRKKREELSVSATKSIKKETVEIVVNFT